MQVPLLKVDAQGFDTLVLNYEAPWHFVNSEPNINEWKAEIMHRSRTMYDRSHALCAPQPRADGKCDRDALQRTLQQFCA